MVNRGCMRPVQRIATKTTKNIQLQLYTSKLQYMNTYECIWQLFVKQWQKPCFRMFGCFFCFLVHSFCVETPSVFLFTRQWHGLGGTLRWQALPRLRAWCRQFFQLAQGISPSTYRQKTSCGDVFMIHAMYFNTIYLGVSLGCTQGVINCLSWGDSMRQNHVTKRRPSDRKLKKLNAILEVATSRLSRLHKGVILEVFIAPDGLAAGCKQCGGFPVRDC